MKLTNYFEIAAVRSRGEVFTKGELVREILSRLPDELFYNETKTFFVPGCGTGIFLIEVIKKIESFGYTFKEASSRVFGCDIRVKFINRLRRRGYNVYKIDFLNEEFNMIFDVILTNPPYNGANKQIKQWVNFYGAAYPILAKDGYVVYVTPKSWMTRPDSKVFKPVSELFLQNDLLYANTDVNKYFTNVGEDIGYQILQKSKTENLKTTIDNNGDIFEIIYNGQKIPLSNSESIKFSIFDKIESYDDKLKTYFTKRSADDAGRALRKEKFVKNKTDIHNVPVLYTLNQTYYTMDNDFDLSKKVFFNYSGYFYKENKIDKYMPVLDGYISGQATFSVRVPNDLTADNLRHNYTRKIIRYYVDNEKTGGFNTGIPNLPWLGYDKKYTDSELYDLFNLNEKEIQEVEKCVG